MSKTTLVNMHGVDRDGYDVRIDRKSIWGNPFALDSDTPEKRKEVIAMYHRHILSHRLSLLARLEELRGKRLGCWCTPKPCHGDVLIHLLEEPTPSEKKQIKAAQRWFATTPLGRDWLKARAEEADKAKHKSRTLAEIAEETEERLDHHIKAQKDVARANKMLKVPKAKRHAKTTRRK